MTNYNCYKHSELQLFTTAFL